MIIEKHLKSLHRINMLTLCHKSIPKLEHTRALAKYIIYPHGPPTSFMANPKIYPYLEITNVYNG